MRSAVTVLSVLLLVSACRKETPAPGPSGTPSRSGTAVLPGDARNAQIDTHVDVRHQTPFFMQKSMLGTKLAADGTVESDNATVPQGQPVYLTLWLKESPAGLQTTVKWYGKDGKVMKHEQHAMNGGKTVTFTLSDPKLAAGTYRVEGLWGGNLAADKSFDVVAAQPAAHKAKKR
jgi:hypothetical protein